jgi:hypothetical protein
MHDRVAAIDVHKDMVKVAVRVPGERRGTRLRHHRHPSGGCLTAQA